MVFALLAVSLVGATSPQYSVVVARRIGVTPELAGELATALARSLETTAGPKLGKLVQPSDVQARLVAAGLPESSVCNGATACVATLARVCDVSHLVALQVVKVGSDLALDLSVVESHGTSVASLTRTVKAKTWSDELPSLAQELVAALPVPAPVPAVVAETPPAPAPAPAEPGAAAPGITFGVRGEVMGSLPIAKPQSDLYGLGVALRASGILSLASFFDLLLNVGYDAWSATPKDPLATGASMFTIGAGARVRRPFEHALVIPTGDVGVGYVATGGLSHVAITGGASLLLRGTDRWSVLLGPVVRFEYVAKVQDESGYGNASASILSFGLAVEFAPGAVTPERHVDLTPPPPPPQQVLDDDLDGVPNAIDKCPIDKGLARYEGCPEDDADADGVRGVRDACPLVPGLPTLNGCPDDDRDGDGVHGASDLCPEKKGSAEDNGCPRMLLVKVTEKKLELLQKILFAFGLTTILPRSTDLLTEVATVLTENTNFCVRIEGHTDNIGGAQKNKALSQGRADAVRSFLIAGGVAANRMYSVGYGMEIPRDSNANADGRENNRRVEFVFVPCNTPELRPGKE
ncbi:MAG: OmpA family protein [Archangium sp.]|nr:OmpA family protein [Archangium sp.]